MKFIVIFAVSLLIFTGFIMSNKQQAYTPSKGGQFANNTLAKTAKIINEKYNIKPCGAGVAMPGGPIQELTLCFDTKFTYTKDQLRELLINSAQELINQVNKNDTIQQFIKDPPFTIKNVEIIIYNNDEEGKDVYDPKISTARISQGILIYRTNDKNDSFKYKNKFEESYEDALRAMSKL